MSLESDFHKAICRSIVIAEKILHYTDGEEFGLTEQEIDDLYGIADGLVSKRVWDLRAGRCSIDAVINQDPIKIAEEAIALVEKVDAKIQKCLDKVQ